MGEINTEAKKYRKLFVGGLSRETNEVGLKSYFEQWGKVVDCVVVRNPVTGVSKGFSFLVFKESVTLDEVQASRPHIIDNQCVETRRAMPYYKNPGELRNVKMVYSGRVRKDTTEEDIRRAFSKYGEIEKIEWVINNSGKYTGFLFLTFKDIDSVDKCVLQSRVLVNNTRVVVSRAVPKSESEKTPAQTTPLPSNYLQFSPYVSQCYPSSYPDGSNSSMSGTRVSSPVYYTPTPVYNYPVTAPENGATYLPGYPPNAYIGPHYVPFCRPVYDVYSENETTENSFNSIDDPYYQNDWPVNCTRPALLRQHL